MSRHGGMSRIEAVNLSIVDREDKRIQKEATEGAGRKARTFAYGSSDPLKFPWYALGSELLPMPRDER